MNLFNDKDIYESVGITKNLINKCLFKTSKKNKLINIIKKVQDDNIDDYKTYLTSFVCAEKLLEIIKHNDDVFSKLDEEQIDKYVKKCKSKIDDRNYLYSTKQNYCLNIVMIHAQLLNKDITLDAFYDDIKSVEILYNIEQPKHVKK